METRICKTCQIEKELTKVFFRPNGHCAGFRNSCRECEAKKQKSYKALNPEKHNEAARQWSKNNPERRNATKRNWNRANPEKIRFQHIKATYNLTAVEYEVLLKQQKGACAICGFVFSLLTGDRTVSPHVDHCHATGKVRGLLCTGCNKGIGALKDDFFTVIKAASYLRKFIS